MLRPGFFIETLKEAGIDCFAGVPDSLLKNLCAYITDHFGADNNVISANEGAAIGFAAGHYLATGLPACVYMQNSGEGNIINPLASLTDPEVYNIPVLLIIGWRGRPGVHDEPQHIKQGKVTLALLDTMGIGYEVLSKEEELAARQVKKAAEALAKGYVYALIVEKDTFEEYRPMVSASGSFEMSREEAVIMVAGAVGEKDCIVSTTGMISRELFEMRTAKGQGHGQDFLTVGSMGHASQIALGVALARPERRVWCLDGDGAVIMHMGSLAVTASKHPRNLVHVVFNNGAHDSVGGQPTVALNINLSGAAVALGYGPVYSVSTKKALLEVLETLSEPSAQGPAFLEIKVRKGNRKDLGRPTTTPAQNKEAFMSFLKK